MDNHPFESLDQGAPVCHIFHPTRQSAAGGHEINKHFFFRKGQNG